MILAILVLATTLTQTSLQTFPVPNGQIPTEIARLGDDMVFVAWKNWPALEPQLGRVNARGRIQLAPMEKDHMPGLIARAPDGTLWLSDGKERVLWHVLADGRSVTVPIARTTLGVAVDADGAVWATHPGKSDVSRYSREGEVQSVYLIGRRRGRSMAQTGAVPAPKPANAPRPIPPKVPSTQTMTKQQRQARLRDSEPTFIVLGPDKAMWYSETTYKTIGRISPTGQIDAFAIPPEWGAPRAIVAGKDALWFVVANTPVLGRIDTEGVVTGVNLPAMATSLAADDQGRIFFATANAFGYVADGKVKMLDDLPKAERLIRSMAAGADGAIWFADQKAKTIGRIDW